jgi:hypothetical protein
MDLLSSLMHLDNRTHQCLILGSSWQCGGPGAEQDNPEAARD